MKRILTLMMAIIMMLSLVACGGDKPVTEPSGDKTATETPKGDPIRLSLGHTNNMEHHYHKLAEQFKATVEEKTNGEIIVDIYPAEQLGSGVEMLEAVKSGTQDLVIDPDPYIGNYCPNFHITGMPFVFSDWDQVKKYIESDLCRSLEEEAKAQNMNILGWTANGFRYFTTKKPLESIADLNGLKIRVGSSPLMSDIIVSLGANPTTMPMSETYTGIQTGVVDGQENPLANIIGSKFYEVAPYVTMTGHVYSYELLIMNDAKLSSLTPEQQEIIKEAAKAACADDLEYCIGAQEEEIATIEANGGTIFYLDAADIAEAKALTAPVTQKWCKNFGDEFTALYNELLEIIS